VDEPGRTASVLWPSSPGGPRGLYAPRNLCSLQYTRPRRQTSCHWVLRPRLRGEEHRRGARADGQGRLPWYQNESRMRAEYVTLIILRLRASLLACAAERPLQVARPSVPRHMAPRHSGGLIFSSAGLARPSLNMFDRPALTPVPDDIGSSALGWSVVTLRAHPKARSHFDRHGLCWMAARAVRDQRGDLPPPPACALLK
jgi:hypothetical protein